MAGGGFARHDQAQTGVLGVAALGGEEGLEHLEAPFPGDAGPAVGEAHFDVVGVDTAADAELTPVVAAFEDGFHGVVDQLFEQVGKLCRVALHTGQVGAPLPVHHHAGGEQARCGQTQDIAQQVVEVDRAGGFIEVGRHGGAQGFQGGLAGGERGTQVAGGFAARFDQIHRRLHPVQRPFQLEDRAGQGFAQALDAFLFGQHRRRRRHADGFLLAFEFADVLHGEQQPGEAFGFVEGIGMDVQLLEPGDGTGQPARLALVPPEFEFLGGNRPPLFPRQIEVRAQLVLERGQHRGGRLAAEVADELFVFLVVQHHPLVAVQQGDADLGRIDHRFDHRLLVLHLALQAVDFGHVTVHAEEMGGGSVAIQHRGDGEVGEIAAAVTAAVDQQTIPGALPLQLRPQGFVHDLGRDLVGEDGFVLADDFILAVTGHPLEGRVGVEDVGAGIGDGDGQRRLLHRQAEELRGQVGIGGGHGFVPVGSGVTGDLASAVPRRMR